MLKSQTPLIAGSGQPDDSERAVNFQFSITWSFLFDVPGATKTASATELLVPEVLRPDARVESTSSEEVPASIPPFYARPSGIPKLFLAAALLTAIAVPIWRHANPAQPKAKLANFETNPRGGGWIRETASSADAGGSQARALNIYQPSLNARDGQFEFTWTADAQGAAWIYRAKDLANYYAVRMKILSQTPSLRLSVEHFTVYLGNEGSHSEKVLDLARNNSTLRIKLDVAGPSFTLYLNGNAVDYWTDARLTSGGFGFLEEWHQGPVVRSVRMSFAEALRTENEQSLRDTGALYAKNPPHLFVRKAAPASGGV